MAAGAGMIPGLASLTHGLWSWRIAPSPDVWRGTAGTLELKL
jgi:hypothetical protein